MIAYNPELAAKTLSNTLNKLFSREVVMTVLKMETGDLTEEAWLDHARTVGTRFYTYCLHQAGLPLTLERDGLTVAEYGNVMFIANNLLREGFSYTTLYPWWRCEGQFLHTQAYALKRQMAAIAGVTMRVMVFIAGKKPQYLGKSGSDYVLVDDVSAARHFPLVMATETCMETREDYLSQFDYLKTLFGAERIKILTGNAFP